MSDVPTQFLATLDAPAGFPRTHCALLRLVLLWGRFLRPSTRTRPLGGPERSQAIEDRLPVPYDKLANAGLSAIPGEVILRLSLGRVVRSNGVRFAEALSR